MIDMQKTYRTRDGREVRIYATDGQLRNEVHGAVFSEHCGWVAGRWNRQGMMQETPFSTGDLVEAKPRIKLKKWLVASPNGGAHLENSEADARFRASRWMAKERCAIKCIEIDCEEGEGLE